jgi:hypothetical protein
MGLSTWPPAGAAVARWATKPSTAGAAVLGTPQTQSIPSATYTSWVQLTAATSADGYLVAAYAMANSSFTAAARLEAGRGASGSEVVIGAVMIGSPLGGGQVPFTPPMRIPAGTAVSVRMYGYSSSGGGTLEIGLLWVPYSNIDGS